MSKQSKYFYEFGPFRIDTVNRRLLRDGELVPLKAKAVETLLLLVRQNGEVVEKEELMQWLWPDSFVEEANLTQNIYMLRKALGDCGYIETVPRRGYRFAAEVREWEESPSELIVIQEKTRTSVSYEEETDEGSAHQLPGVGLETVDDDRTIQMALGSGRAVVQSSNVASPLRARLRRRLWLAVAVIGCVVVFTIVVFWLYRPSAPFAKVKLNRFTTTGKAFKTAISPDGKYLAYVTSDAGQQSLWLRQVATGKDLQLVPPARLEFYGLTFSHDGNYIYYVNQEMNHLGLLFRVPSLGGEPARLIEDVDSPVTLSPDDGQLAFIRFSHTDRSLVVANADGTGERKLASTTQSASLKMGVIILSPPTLIPPAWSPDSQLIACPMAGTAPEGEYQTIWAFQTKDGQGRALTPARWQSLGHMEWLADGSGLLIPAAELGSDGMQQIWHVAYPGGATRKVTNDLNDYRDLSLTKDMKTLAAIQSERRANIFVASAADTSRPSQLTSTNYDGLGGLAWMPDGKLVYTLQAGGEQNLWAVAPDGSAPKQLTAHAGLNRQPTASPDGRYIVFVSNRTGQPHLWRIDADGKRPQELTHGPDDTVPDFTPDGQWVVYQSTINGVSYIFRVAVDGGEPVHLTSGSSAAPVVSPDGKLICLIHRTAPAEPNKIAVIPFAGGEPQLIRDLPAHYGQLRWTPDGRAIAYADKQSGAGNIWIQPLDGSPPQQLTEWRADPVFSFNWSRDGKWLAYASGAFISDVDLITDVGR